STLSRVLYKNSKTNPRDAGWRLRGQLLGEERPSRVALVSQVDDTVVADATPDETGQFTMDAATGSYELLVEFVESDCVIVMPEVELS
ncbi:MAG: hypothetical protein HKO59_06695, partial [Phycisphaerales bacterium]|nr:hypothetical protein [Phycisphaerales bacterium]